MQYQSFCFYIANEELMFQHLFCYTLILQISSYDSWLCSLAPSILLTFVQLDLFITYNFERTDSEGFPLFKWIPTFFFSDKIHVAFYRLLCVVGLEKVGERN